MLLMETYTLYRKQYVCINTQILGLYQKLCPYQATACEHYYS